MMLDSSPTVTHTTTTTTGEGRNSEYLGRVGPSPAQWVPELFPLQSQLESALELSRSLQAQQASSQNTIQLLELKVAELQQLVQATQIKVDDQHDAHQAGIKAAIEAVRIPEEEREKEREALEKMINEWKKDRLHTLTSLEPGEANAVPNLTSDMESDGYYTPSDSGDGARQDSDSHEGENEPSFAPSRQGLAKLQTQQDVRVESSNLGPVDTATTSVSESGMASAPLLSSRVER
jgi:hypothetical protein